MEPMVIRTLPSTERPKIDLRKCAFAVKVEDNSVSRYRDKERERKYRANTSCQMVVSPKLMQSAFE